MTREPRSVWIGIQGGTCAGKTTIAQTLASYLDPTDTLILGLDQFYRPVEKGWLKNSPTRNFDDPSSLDWNSFRQAALTLEAGLTAEVALYDGLSKLGDLHL